MTARVDKKRHHLSIFPSLVESGHETNIAGLVLCHLEQLVPLLASLLAQTARIMGALIDFVAHFAQGFMEVVEAITEMLLDVLRLVCRVWE